MIGFQPSFGYKIGKFLALAVWVMLHALTSIAQTTDSSDKITIHIIHARTIIFNKTDSGDYHRFLGDVVLQQGTDTLYCDSAYQNNTTKNFEAFSNVRIAQMGGTEGICNYLKYTAATKMADMQGQVRLTDGKNKLWCQSLDYNVGDKIGTYSNGGQLQSDSTYVSSTQGRYDVNNKEARFSGKVQVIDPHYHTYSEDMGYNTDTKLTHFYAPSTVVSDSGRSVLHATKGSYNPQLGLAGFSGHSSIWDKGQYIEADTLYYNKQTGYGYAYGKVVAMDTAHHSVIYCGWAQYYQKQRVLWAYDQPVLMHMRGLDTFYMRADTLYMAPDKRWSTRLDSSVKQSVVKTTAVSNSTQPKGKKSKKTSKEVIKPQVAVLDTAVADTSAPITFSGFHHVKLFNDSIQAVCDSICFTEVDSTVRLIGNPIAWSRESQITGDTIALWLDSSSVRQITVPNNAFVVSQTGPIKAGIYDQIQGRTLKGFMKNNALQYLVVYPDAEAIYFPKDNAGAYIGLSKATADKMYMYMGQQQVQRIKLEEDVHQVLTPMLKADLPNAKLSRFLWKPTLRPKDKYELFE